MAGPGAAPASVEYERRKAALAGALAPAGGDAPPPRLDKKTSNLFRTREGGPARRIPTDGFDRVLRVDPVRLEAEAGGMATFEAIVAETLKHGCLPTVVPELKTITIGGAISGIGIEASSFRYGFVHETVLEMDLLLADGNTVTCTPDNQYQDLFRAVANSYGTLGYVLRARFKLVKAAPYVEIARQRFTDARAFVAALEGECARAREAGTGRPDYVEGVVFGPKEMYLQTGRFAAKAPWLSDYKYRDVFYKSIPRKEVDYLTASDFIWRWDTDWFWCSRAFGMQRPLIRALAGKWLLGSRSLWKIMDFYRRHKLEERLARYSAYFRKRREYEPVIQDVEVPAAGAAEFLEFYHREIRILPLWVCPVRAYDPSMRYDLYEMDPGALYLNFGFWESVHAPGKPRGYYNRRIELEVARLGGRKSLYSDSYYPEDEFWRIYNRPAYDRLKAKYDPDRRFKDLYAKTVLKG